MNFKKLSVSLLAMAMLAGCGSSSASATASAASATDGSASKGSIDVLKMQFVPSRDAETILQGTSKLPELLKEQMAKRGYDIGDIEITVGAGSDYNVTGEALASGSVDVAWLPASTYANYSDDTTLALTATRDALSNDSEDPKTWNGEANATTRIAGEPVTYYRGLMYAGPSENGRKIAAKVEAGEENHLGRSQLLQLGSRFHNVFLGLYLPDSVAHEELRRQDPGRSCSHNTALLSAGIRSGSC